MEQKKAEKITKKNTIKKETGKKEVQKKQAEKSGQNKKEMIRKQTTEKEHKPFAQKHEKERNAAYAIQTGAKAKKKETKSKSPCPISKQCGGCVFLNETYQKQLSIKQTTVKDLLKGICPVEPILGMENPYHYRNKVHAAFAHRRTGEIVSGIYKEGTHEVVGVEECLIEDKKADAIIGTIRSLLKSFKIRVYDEDSGYGLLRHVLVRRGFASGQILVALVVASPIFPSKNNFVKALRKEHPEISTIVLNINDKQTSMVLGERNITLFGKGYIEDVLCGLTFRLSPNSFYQVNPVQTEKLYTKALELAALTGTERVIDAYCGIGTIGLIASKKAKEVIGVELNPDAVKDAKINAQRNEIKNAVFYQGDAGEFMVEMAARGEKADVVLMDPPRQGSSDAFIDSVAKLAPKKVVYVSCSPETLARDLKKFAQKGYRSEIAYPVDMFPWTQAVHVETVVLLQRVNQR